MTFGGFNKQDVIEYIGRVSQEAAAAQKALQEENDALREKLTSAEGEAETLRRQVEQMRAELKTERTRRETLESLEPLRAEVERLTAENETLRPDAEAYAQFRERIGAIECEARKRAADLEDEANARMRQVVDQFRAQYQTLMSTFETTAAYVNGELRKVEVNLSQLPRALDRPGTELNELAARLEKAADKN